MVAVAQDPERRFWNRVNGPWCDPRLDGYEDCWLWMGATIKSRPPRMRFVKPWQRYGRFHLDMETRNVNAHRAALRLTVGGPPSDGKTYVASHLCDNSMCVHPGHLEWQTQQQNIAGAVARGRLTRTPNAASQGGSRWASTGAAT